MKRAVAIAIDERNSVPLHFALARAYHDRKLHAEAFDHYREANRQRAESLGYNARELTEEIAELERVVTADFVRALPAVAGGGDSVRSAERRVGKECVSTCRSRGSPDN